MLPTFWETLGIEPTRDERAIKRAYAARLKMTRPEDDPDAFQRLVTARDWALNFARSPEEEEYSFEPVEPAALPPEPIPVTDLDPEPSPEPPQPVFLPEPQAEAPQTSRDPEPDPAFVKLSKDLDALVASILFAQGPNRGDSWSAEPWARLLNDSAQLSIDDRNRFFVLVARKIGELLPPCHIAQRDEFAAFRTGCGKSAVVEAIEKECQFTWVGSGFERHLSHEAVTHYYDWLSVAKSARQLLDRLQNPSKAYFQKNSAIPLLPEEDLPVLLNSVPLRNYYEAVSKSGEWLYRVHERSVLLPAGQLLLMNVLPQGLIHFFAGLALVVAAWYLLPTSVDAFLACLAALALLHLVAAFTYQKTVLRHRGRLVHKADSAGEMIRSYRVTYFLEKLGKSRWISFFVTMDILVKLSLVVPLLMLPEYLSIARNGDKTIHAIISPKVTSVLETVINNPSVSNEELLAFFTRLKDTQTALGLGPGDRTTRADQVKDFYRLRDIESARAEISSQPQDIDFLSGFSGNSSVVRTERGRKLKRILDTYMASDPEQKAVIEGELTDWLKQVKSVEGNTDVQTALWILMPPRTVDHPLLRPAEVLRPYLTQFFFQNINSPAFVSLSLKSYAVNSGLLRILAMSDEEIEAAIPTGKRLSDAVNNTDLTVLSLALPPEDWNMLSGRLYGSSSRTMPAASLEIGDWHDFLKTAELCLTGLPAYDREKVRLVARQGLNDALQSRKDLEASTWQKLTRDLLSVPYCRLFVDIQRNYKDPSLVFDYSEDLHTAVAAARRDGDRARVDRFAFMARQSLSSKLADTSDSETYIRVLWAAVLLRNGSPSETLREIDKISPFANDCAGIHALQGRAFQSLGMNAAAEETSRYAAIKHSYGIMDCDKLPDIPELTLPPADAGPDNLKDAPGATDNVETIINSLKD